jgi:hypothetical protein
VLRQVGASHASEVLRRRVGEVVAAIAAAKQAALQQPQTVGPLLQQQQPQFAPPASATAGVHAAVSPAVMPANTLLSGASGMLGQGNDTAAVSEVALLPQPVARVKLKSGMLGGGGSGGPTAPAQVVSTAGVTTAVASHNRMHQDDIADGPAAAAPTSSATPLQQQGAATRLPKPTAARAGRSAFASVLSTAVTAPGPTSQAAPGSGVLNSNTTSPAAADRVQQVLGSFALPFTTAPPPPPPPPLAASASTAGEKDVSESPKDGVSGHESEEEKAGGMAQQPVTGKGKRRL